MSLEYFFTPPHLIGHNELTIEGDEFAHLTHVMRRKPGDAIRVVNGAGTALDVVIIETSRHTARCEITATHSRLHEPDADVTMGVGVLKNSSRFDFLVEKATELGVNTIVPLSTERTIPHHARTDRWQKLALAAMKQSCRCTLPAIKDLTPLATFLRSASQPGCCFIPHEATDTPRLRDVPYPPPLSRVLLAIGPEGGFTDAEIAEASEAGFTPISLGQRRLRAETAAIIAAGHFLSL